jgi:hypothetical protein
VTDGFQTKNKGHFTPLGVASTGLKKNGVYIYSLGIGSDTDIFEILDIASDEDGVFSVRSFDDLTNIGVEIQNAECKGILTLLTYFMTKHGLLREKVTYSLESFSFLFIFFKDVC